MRFHSKEKPRGLLTQRDQRRLSLLIVGVAVVMIGFAVVRRPGFWSGIFPADGAAETGAERPRPGATLAVRADEFLVGDAAPAVTETTSPADWVDRESIGRFERSEAGLDKPGPELPDELLRTIRDDVIGVQSTEADAYFVTLRLAQKLPSVGRTNTDPASYALMMDAPDQCRGRVWKVRGTMRRITQVASDANSFGVRQLFDAWISTPDSGNQLIHVVAPAADAAFAALAGGRIQEMPVELDGIYFKREGYQRAGSDGNGDIGLAPLLLAGRLRYAEPKSSAVSRADELTPWLGWVSAGVCLGVALVILQFQLSDRGFRGTRTHQLTALPVRPSFAGVDAESVSESLRRMEQQAGDG